MALLFPKKIRTYLKTLIVKICANYHFWKTLFSPAWETVGLLLTRGRKNLELEMSKGETQKDWGTEGRAKLVSNLCLISIRSSHKNRNLNIEIKKIKKLKIYIRATFEKKKLDKKSGLKNLKESCFSYS